MIPFPSTNNKYIPFQISFLNSNFGIHMKNRKQVIYLDNNATTPIDPRVLEAMMPFLTDQFANANSTHAFGVEAYEAVKTARKQVADLIGAEPYEIVFTSGATEAINLAIKGAAEKYKKKGRHIITVSTEHPAVLDTTEYLESIGYEVTYLPVNHEGLVDLQEVKNALREETILVSVMYVNNETGVIQPIQEISELAHNVDAIFMSDCTQAAGKIPIDVEKLGIDLLCLSGHKIYAPKGVGALYIRQRENRIKIPAVLHGGGHERGFRSGTLNVPGIVALGAACLFAKNEMNDIAKAVGELRDHLEAELLKIENTSINGSTTKRIYNVTNILVEGVDSDAVIMGLSNSENEQPLIAVSNGSACTSASIKPSHVLIAMGLNETEAFCSIRISLGKYSSIAEIDAMINFTKKVINDLKQMLL
jgi:cysteine desulfurase